MGHCSGLLVCQVLEKLQLLKKYIQELRKIMNSTIIISGDEIRKCFL